MHEDDVVHAETDAEELRPNGAAVPLVPADSLPGESFAAYYGRLADIENRRRLLAEERARLAAENLRAMVERRRQKGHSDTDIADDMGCTVEELLKHFGR